MEIIIGSMPPLVNHREKPQERSTGMIEAQVLNVRPPRKGIAGPSGMERREKQTKDPVKGRVLTILVPDGNLLPNDIENSQYTVQIRFVRK